jgi:hypothetical protein
MKNLFYIMSICLCLGLISCKKDDKSQENIPADAAMTTDDDNRDSQRQSSSNNAAMTDNQTSKTKSRRVESIPADTYRQAVLTPTSVNLVKKDGSIDILIFGEAEQRVVGKLSSLLGKQPDKQEKEQDCNGKTAKVISWKEHITLVFVERNSTWQLAGWNLKSRDDQANRIKMTSGNTVGSLRSDLSQKLSTKAKETALGYELNSGGVSWVLTSAEDDATVTYVYSGMNCYRSNADVPAEKIGT